MSGNPSVGLSVCVSSGPVANVRIGVDRPEKAEMLAAVFGAGERSGRPRVTALREHSPNRGAWVIVEQASRRSLRSVPSPTPMSPETRASVEQIVGYQWHDPTLLDLALTHASVAEARVQSNERLEFLGDAVLGLVVCEHIYSTFPDLLEGEMTKIKSTVVSRHSCAALTVKLGLGQFLSLGKGMRVHETLPQSLAAAVLESIVAAIYLDGGLEPARAFLLPLV